MRECIKDKKKKKKDLTKIQELLKENMNPEKVSVFIILQALSGTPRGKKAKPPSQNSFSHANHC